MMIEPLSIWSNLIYKAKCPLDLREVYELSINSITPDSVHSLEKNKGKTTFNTANNLIFDDHCTELRTWLMPIADMVWKSWNFADDLPRFIHRSWVNLHNKGDWTEEHNHGQVHQTIVIYIRQPSGGGNILFKDPLEYVWNGFPKIDKDNWAPVEVQQNDVLFFPGFLKHKTEKNDSDNPRLVMTVTVLTDLFYQKNKIL